MNHATGSGATARLPSTPLLAVERARHALISSDLQDLCDATDAAIEAGGGFGWVDVPDRDTLERYWNGVIAMPARDLLIARLDHTICGALQIIRPPKNNEAQAFAVQLTGIFLAPWARGHGLARALMLDAELLAREQGYRVINLDVRETQKSAINLYESMGYELIGRHPAYASVHGQIVPGRYYYKKID